MKFNSLKYFAATLFAISISIAADAQQTDDVVLRAMKTEIDRSLANLKEDSLARPFFISLLVDENDFSYSYTTSFGQENEEVIKNKKSRDANPMLLVGDYHRTQNFSGSSASFSLPVGDDEIAIRSAIWLNMDNIYKNAAKSYVDKMTWLKQANLTDEEKALDDFEKRKPTILIENIVKENYNFTNIKETSLKISKLLTDKIKKEKLVVEDVRTGFRYTHDIVRYYDTEGSMFKYPYKNGSFNITLSGVNEKGEDVGSFKSFKMIDVAQFPSYAELEKAVNDVVAEYKLKFTAEKIEDPYMGPVLIADEQVGDVVKEIINNLYTAPKTRYSNGNHYQNLPGVRILSKQLSLRADYGKNAQNIPGVKRDLAPIDGQAVIPPDSILLVHNGMLKDMLTSRQPVKKYLHSNGNSKENTGMDGVITFTGTERYHYNEIKKMLIDEARLQGLEFAYVINSDNHVHRKINVETGEETPFIASIDMDEVMKTMRRVLGVENVMVSSADGTVRYPKSILLEDAELKVYKSNDTLKKIYVPRPRIL